VREHVAALEKCNVDVVCVKRKEQLAMLDGLIIPGGESTTIGKLIDRFGLGEAIKEMHHDCAGNCVCKDDHYDHVKLSVEAVKESYPSIKALELYVNEDWAYK
jgi:glutamine amidotransferase PdxT